MQVRRLGPEDTAVFRALRLRALAEHPEAFTTSAEEFARESPEETGRRLAAPQLKLWGAFEAGALRGYVGLDRDTREKTRHRATLVGMYVAPEASGRGVGRALVEALLAQARADGLAVVVLTVTEGNRRAVQLYERCGFRAFGTEPRAVLCEGRFHGKIHMYHLLSP